MKRILYAPDPPLASGAPPAPAATPPPAPAAPAAAPDLVGEPSNDFNAVADAFTKAGVGEPPPPKPAASAEPAKPAAPAQPSPKPADKPAAAPAPAAEPVRTPKELRAEKERLAGELTAAKTAQAALEAKIAEYEKAGHDVKALNARLEAKEKEVSDLRGELHAKSFETDAEFKKKYDAPFELAANDAKTNLDGLTKADETPADFDEDFVPLYRMKYGAAWSKAREIFGDNAPIVMAEVKTLQTLDRNKQVALAEAKANWETQNKEREGITVQQRERTEAAWKQVNQHLSEKDDRYKLPVENKELQDLRQKALTIFDAPAKSDRELLWKNGHIRHMVGMFEPHQKMISERDGKIASLEAELAKHKPRQPNADPSKPSGGEAVGQPKPWEADFKETVANA